MKKLNELKHAEKSEFNKGTSVLISENQYKFIKDHNLNLSRIVRQEIDRLIKLWQKQSQKIS